MAFPAIAASNSGSGLNTSLSCSLPAGVVAGNLLLVMAASTNGGNFAWPAGWTEITEQDSAGVLNLSVGYKIAAGGDAAPVLVGSGAGAIANYITYRITGHDAGTPPEVGTPPAIASTATPDPPSVTPSWGADDTLWVAVMTRKASTNITTYPTSYTLNQVNRFGSDAASRIISAARQLNASGEDPGVFTFVGAAQSAAQTIAIRPGGAITGTLNATEAHDTLATTAEMGTSGTAFLTEAGDTLATTGALAIVGTLAVVEQNDTLAGAGAIAIVGTLSITEAGDTLAAGSQMPIFYPRRGGIDEQQEFERRQREWQEDLRRIIDRSWRIANGEIDPITFEPIPPPDYSIINAVLAAQEMALDRQRAEQFKAEQNRLREDEAIAILLLAA